MTEPQHAVISRLSADFAAASRHLAQASNDLTELDRVLASQAPVTSPASDHPARNQPEGHHPPPQYPAGHYPPQQYPAQYSAPGYYPPGYYPPGYYPPRYYPPQRYPSPQYRPQNYVPPTPPSHRPPSSHQPPTPHQPRSDSWIGKALAIAGVAVTLIGVVLLLVLAAQAGILRPEIRVAAGSALAVGLVAAGVWLHARPGGRVGAIALAATGIATAYMDVMAVTTIYDWVSPPVGLVLAAVIAAAGLSLARWWDSEQLGLLVLVPLILLAPVITDGITLLLIGFMLALSAASLPVQLGKDWIWLHAARITAATFPLLPALVISAFGNEHQLKVASACGLAAMFAIAAALLLLPRTTNRVAMALLTVAGVVPALSVSLAVDHRVAAGMAAALAGLLLPIVLLADRLPGVAGAVRRIWSTLAAVSALIAVTVGFDGEVAGPLLLALAVVVAIAGRHDVVARWAAIGFAAIGAGFYLHYAPPRSLAIATQLTTSAAVSTLIASVLMVASAVAIARCWPGREEIWAGVAMVSVYAVTIFTVTAGVLAGGLTAGFFAGHMAATICWIVMAAGLFGYAARRPKAQRSVPIAAGLALVAAAMAKLFLFDLGTLDGIFRVVVFIVVGLVLLGMGAGYARLLAQQDQQDQQRT